MEAAYPVEGSGAAGMINLQPGEKIVRQCDTIKGLPPISTATHIALTLFTLFTWPFVYCCLVCSWPRINMTVVLTNVRVVFIYNNGGYKKNLPSSRAQQHFPLASVAAVQETFGSSSTCCGSPRSVSTIRIWFRSFPTAFPSAEIPTSAVPLGTAVKAALKDSVKMAMKDIGTSPDPMSLLVKLISKGLKRAQAIARMIEAEVKALFIAPDDNITFPWDSRDPEKLSKSNTFVADLCKLVADAQGSAAHVEASAAVQVVDDDVSSVSIGDGQTVHYARQAYGVGSSEVIGGGALVVPRVTCLDWILVFLTFGIHYFTTVRKLSKTKIGMVTTSNRIITATVMGGGSSYMRIADGEKNRRTVDIRHVFFGGPALGGFMSKMVSGNCMGKKDTGELGIFTRFGTLEYRDDLVAGSMQEAMRNVYVALLRSSVGTRMFTSTSQLEPVKSYAALSDILRDDELHVASIAGKTRDYRGILGLFRWLFTAIVKCCSGPYETRVSVIATSERLAFVNELVHKIGGVDYMYTMVFPLSSLRYFAHTDVDMLQGCCGPSYNPIPGFGDAGLLLRSSAGEVKLPYVHLESDASKISNLFGTLSAVCVQNARGTTPRELDEEDPSNMY